MDERFINQIVGDLLPEQFELRTNRISLTLLIDHFHGHTLAPLHRFASGLLAGVPYERLVASVEELVRLGHSTGWDLWTGFLAGMTSVPPHPPISALM